MNQETFEQIYEGLPRQRKQVLKYFLFGKKDREIAKSLNITASTVRKHRSLLYRDFGLSASPSKIEDLKLLFSTLKPELLNPELLSLELFSNDDEIYLEPELLDSCQNKLLQVGMLLRIKAPKQWGKTLLVNRLLEGMEHKGYQTAYVDVLDADSESCENLDIFLQWLCRNVGRELGVAKEKLWELWDEKDASKVNCSEYFEKAIFPEVELGLVLAFDNIERIFPSNIAEDVLTTLRAWFEKSKQKKNWSKLRLIVAYSTECYVPMNANQSPFNVGEAITLSEFNFQQVKELMGRHGVSLKDEEIGQLIEMIGGHPFLVERGIAFLKDNPSISLDEMLAKAATLEGIYSDHLRDLWRYIQEREELVTAMKQVVSEKEGADLKSPPLAHQLESLGVVKLDGNKVMPRCDLYREFFHEQLG